MDIARAKELLTILSDGINPITGELLPEEDSCNQVEIVRAINILLRELENMPKHKNAGTPWSEEDESVLCRLFDSGTSIADLSIRFGRSKGSIFSRLIKLGKIEKEQSKQAVS